MDTLQLVITSTSFAHKRPCGELADISKSIKYSTNMTNSKPSPEPMTSVLVSPELTESQTDPLTDSNREYKLSRRRWAVLFAVTLFGFASSFLDEVSSILNTICKLLDLDLKQYIYISQVFGYVPLVNTIFTAWFLDKYGLKAALYGTTAIMFVRNAFRALLFSPEMAGWAQYKIIYWIISSVAAVQVTSLYYCTPLKISESWFSASERSFAWTVIISATSLGASVGAFIFPRIIHEVSDVKPLANLNIIFAVLTTLAVLTCVTRSEPKCPPSERMLESTRKPIPYLQSIKSAFLDKRIVVHLLFVAICDGIFITIATLIQPMLMASGHSRIFIGNLISINSFLSLVATLSLSGFVHKLTNIALSCKIAALISNVALCFRLYVMIYPFSDTTVLIATITYYVSSGWTLPNFNNMTAHITCGVVAQGTISGLAAMSVIVVVSLCRATFVSLMRQVDGKDDYTYPALFIVALRTICTLMYVIFFDGQPAKPIRGRDNPSALESQ